VRQAAANPGQVRVLRRQLEGYRRVLPSLDLKRRQLSAALAAERQELVKVSATYDATISSAGSRLPMLAGAEPSLDASITAHVLPAPPQMIAGVPVEGLAALQVEVVEPGLCGGASWMDGFMDEVRRAGEQRLHVEVRSRRVAQLDSALRRASQRVNLLEKLLIPRTAQRLRSVEIVLGDLKRAEVIRAKLAKARQHM
jgi:V/A-type H+-transporting ATPase subunit D